MGPAPDAVFPPSLISLLPKLGHRGLICPLAGLVLTVALAAVWARQGQPQVGLLALCHPLAALGHGLALFLAGTLLRSRLLMGSARAGIAAMRLDPDDQSWASKARAICRAQFGSVALPSLYQPKYAECRAAWEAELRRRRNGAFLLTALLILPGTASTLMNLTPENAKTTNLLELALPTLVSCLQAVIISVAMSTQDDRWSYLLLHWQDEALACDQTEYDQLQRLQMIPPEAPANKEGIVAARPEHESGLRLPNRGLLGSVSPGDEETSQSTLLLPPNAPLPQEGIEAANGPATNPILQMPQTSQTPSPSVWETRPHEPGD
jgi:hypothetical protein